MIFVQLYESGIFAEKILLLHVAPPGITNSAGNLAGLGWTGQSKKASRTCCDQHPVGHGKSQGQPRFKELVNNPHFLVGGVTCAHRKGRN